MSLVPGHSRAPLRWRAERWPHCQPSLTSEAAVPERHSGRPRQCGAGHQVRKDGQPAVVRLRPPARQAWRWAWAGTPFPKPLAPGPPALPEQAPSSPWCRNGRRGPRQQLPLRRHRPGRAAGRLLGPALGRPSAAPPSGTSLGRAITHPGRIRSASRSRRPSGCRSPWFSSTSSWNRIGSWSSSSAMSHKVSPGCTTIRAGRGACRSASSGRRAPMPGTADLHPEGRVQSAAGLPC